MSGVRRPILRSTMLAPCLPTTVLIEPSEPGRFIVVTLRRADTLGSASASFQPRLEQAALGQLGPGEDRAFGAVDAHRAAGRGSARRSASPGTGRQQPAEVEGDPGRQADQRGAAGPRVLRWAGAGGGSGSSRSPLRASLRLSSGWMASEHGARCDRPVADRGQQILDRFLAQAARAAFSSCLVVDRHLLLPCGLGQELAAVRRDAPRAGAAAGSAGSGRAPCR